MEAPTPMETPREKCSTKKHSEIDAIIYCQECEKYFCNKCKNNHSEMFEEHKIISLNSSSDIFIDTCKEKNHGYKLEFYCKTHNTLCCASCIARIKEGGFGQHSNCDVCQIKSITNEKRNKLKENINILEKLSYQIENLINELKKKIEEINKDKEELKKKIQKIFTNLRNLLNEREDEILFDIDVEYEDKYFKEDIIKESEKLPNKIKNSIDKGIMIEKEWNENNLTSLINDCIIIENNIKDINKINDFIKKFNINKNDKILYNIDDEQINDLILNIEKFGMQNFDNNSYDNSFDDSYDDVKIEMKNPIHILTNHSSFVYCLCILKDGRLVSGSDDKRIIIYNKNKFKPDLIIKEHNSYICCLIQLSSGELVSCSGDKTIKIFNINGNKYKVLQTLIYHTNTVCKIVELNNKTLCSCSYDSSIIFYQRNNGKYIKDYQITTNGYCSSIIQTKDSEICYSEYKDSSLCFYDILKRKNIAKISSINKDNGIREWFIMIKKDLLLIPGNNQLSIINTNEYKLVRKVEVPFSGWITGTCLMNNNMLLTGDFSKKIKQWKIEGNNLIFMSGKEKTHDKDINVLLNLGNGLIASGSSDNTIKIW